MSKIVEWIKNHKLPCIIAGVILLVVIIVCICLFAQTGTWKEGGSNTSAPFRYRISGNTIDVRVSIENLSADGFAVLTADSEQIQSESKGKLGTEVSYKITVDKNSDRMSWSLAYYDSDNARESDDKSYMLLLDISRNAKNKLTVSANATDMKKNEAISTDSYEVSYSQNGSFMQIEITKPQGISWQAEYDDSIITVSNIFMTESSTTATVIGKAEGDWETSLVFYNYMYDSDGNQVHDQEIKLKLKGTDTTVSEVTEE